MLNLCFFCTVSLKKLGESEEMYLMQSDTLHNLLHKGVMVLFVRDENVIIFCIIFLSNPITFFLSLFFPQKYLPFMQTQMFLENGAK